MDNRPSYKAPDWFAKHIFNPAVETLTRAGVSVLGSRVLRVHGRQSGLWRETPVNLLGLDDRHYLVAPRGETQWVRNLRASGGGELRVGRGTQGFTAREIDDDEKAARPPRLPEALARVGGGGLRPRGTEVLRGGASIGGTAPPRVPAPADRLKATGSPGLPAGLSSPSQRIV
jgi:deazaflavin-dependent oxidoreductase (nitroreductase family)